MRIAFVVHDYNRTGGHSRYVAELAERFANDHEVHVFANTFDTDLPPGAVRHHVPALRATALTTILSFVVPAALRVRGPFDVVHAQGVVLPRADVITVHISNLRWLNGRRRQNGRLGWRDRLFAGLVVPLERHAYTRPETSIIAISSALRQDLEALYGCTGPMTVIHHGVDQRQFHAGVRSQYRAGTRAALGIPNSDVVFLFVGDARKGAVQVMDALGDVAGRLVVVTRSDHGPLWEAARAAGVESRVALVPPTDHIERFYGAADVFVLPTPYDAFGMVITEAMACGVPAITTTAAGASEVVDDGRTGILLRDVADRTALVDAMRRFGTDASFRREAGTAAARAMVDLSWDAVATRTLAVYEELVASRGAR